MIYTYRLVVILLVAFLVIIPFFWPSKDIEANGIFDTASDMNAWSVGDPEVNQLLYGTACPISPAQGSLWGGLMKPWAKILSTDYQTYSEFLAEVTESDGNGGCKITAENFVQRQARLNNPDATRGLSGVVLAASNKLLDERPASGQVYFQQQVYAIKNLGQVNAQDNADALYYPGNGFTLLKPIQDFWGWSVNIVYGLMIFLIIGVAFSIMFRAQLPGGVSVTIQNAIPNIALAMILIPLSYAISGLFIDSVTIGTNVVRQFLIGPGAPARSVYENRNCDSPDDNNKPPGCIGYAENDRGLYPDDPRLTWYSSGGNVNVSDEIQHGLQSIGSTIIGDNLGLTVAAILEVLGQSDTGPIAWIGDIINFFIRILLFFTGLRILKLLLMKYLVFLLAPIASPFIFATIAIPGNGTKQIMQFAKIMGAASLFYIVTYAMFLLAIIFSTEAFQNSIPDLGKSGYVPPLLGLEELISGGGDLLFNSVNALVFGVLAIMIYLNVPNILNSIDDSMGTKAVIPTFVSGAFSSAKDSFNLANDVRKNLTLREGTMSRKAIGGVMSVPGRVTNTALNAYGETIRARQNVANALDRIRGRRPGEVGTTLFRRREDTTDAIAAEERKRLDAVERGDDRAALAAQMKIGVLRRRLEDINKAGGDNKLTGADKEFKDHKELKLQATVTFAGQPIPIKLSDKLRKIVTDPQYQIRVGGVVQRDLFGRPRLNLSTVSPIPGGKLEIKTEGFKLSPNFVSRLKLVQLGSIANYRATGGKNLVGGNHTETDATKMPLPNIAAKDLTPPGGILNLSAYGNLPGSPISQGFLQPEGATNALRLVFATGGRIMDNPDASGSTWSIAFSIEIVDIYKCVGIEEQITEPTGRGTSITTFRHNGGILDAGLATAKYRIVLQEPGRPGTDPETSGAVSSNDIQIFFE